MKVKILKVPKAEYGMNVPFSNGNNIQIENDDFEMLSPYTSKLLGNYHSENRPDGSSGTDIYSNGQEVEAENNETVHIDNRDGSTIIGGNLHIPGTKTKFKSAFKEVAKSEAKTEKVKNKASYLLNNFDGKTRYQAPTFNTGKVMSDAYQQKHKVNEEVKNYLTDTQNAMLEMADQQGIEPQDISKHMKGKAEFGKRIAKDGDKIKGDTRSQEIYQIVDNAAAKYDIDPQILHKLITTESGYNPKAKSNRGALGIMQFTKPTAKAYGVDDILTSNDIGDISKVVNAGANHIQDLLKNYGGDYKLALAAYNGGPKAVQFARNLSGNKNITGNDWQNIIAKRRQDHPVTDKNAWQNQTFDYVDTITRDQNPIPFRQNYNYNVDMKGETPMQPITPMGNTPVGRPDISMPPMSAITPTNPIEKPVPYKLPDNAVVNTLNAPVIANKKGKGLRNRFHPSDYLGEITTLLDSPEPVPSMQINPILEPEYNVSFQARKNAIISAYKPAMDSSRNNPGAQTSIAGQMAQQLAQIDADEFAFNQQNTGQIRGQNLQELRHVRDTNTQLTADQMNKQVAARTMTNENKFRAASSISQKEAQRRASNNQLQQYEQYTGRIRGKNGEKYMTGSSEHFSNIIADNSYDPYFEKDKTYRKRRDKNGNESYEEVIKEKSYFGSKIAKRY